MMKNESSNGRADGGTFRQQVRLPALQVAGLGDDDLALALAYELEPASGIPAAAAVVSFRPVADADPTVRVYDVTVTRRAAARAGAGSRAFAWLLGAGLVWLAVLAADAAYTHHRAAEAARLAAERTALDAQLRAVRNEAQDARAEAEALRAAHAAQERAQARAADLRAEHGALLADVAAAYEARAVVTGLDIGETRATLAATALTPQAASEAAAALAVRVKPRGWSVRTETMETTATIAFTCILTREETQP